MEKTPKNVDAYIAAAPREMRAKLKQIRRIINTTAPKAHEYISYKMPYYKYHGALAGFAAFKNHISLFVPPPVISEHKHELRDYETAKATVRLPLDRPLPATLVKKLVKARMQKNEIKKKAK